MLQLQRMLVKETSMNLPSKGNSETLSYPDWFEWEYREDLTNEYITYILRKLPRSYRRSYVNIYEIDDDNKLPPAYTSGFNLWPLGPIGNICIQQGTISSLDELEFAFIVGHEWTHIYLNHLPKRLFVNATIIAIEQFFTLLLKTEIHKPLSKLKSVLASRGVKILGVKITADQELEADAWGAWLIHSTSKAIQALRKLGEEDDRITHFDEEGTPALILGERIESLLSLQRRWGF